MTLPIGTRFGPHVVEALLGKGGMGEVYLARDTRLDRLVAVKVLGDELASDGNRRERFEREARAVAALSHPHICTLFDVGRADGVPYLVMEYVDGPTLADRLRDGGLQLGDALRYGSQISGALAAAHARRVIHRDLKPANVKLAPSGAKVLDFGLAKFLDAAPGDGRGADDPTVMATRSHTVLGTAPYMSPEQARGTELDHRTDIWSLGVVLWEMLTGTALFAGRTTADAISAVLRAPIDLASLPEGTPAAVRDLLARLLEREREDRLADAATAETVLAAAAATLGSGTAAPAAPRPEPAAKPAGETSILVLPFTNSSPDPENEYFSDGLTEEVIADLSQIGALRVISRTTAMRLKGTDKDLATLAGELDVQYALEGSVRKAGPNLRITARLIDTGSDQALWSEKFRGTLDDVFAIQEQVSRAIAGALRVKLTASEERQLEAPSRVNAFAYDTYLRARRDIGSFLPDRLARAEQELKHALTLVGDDVLLYSGLGLVNWQYINAGISGDRRYLAEAERYARKVIELDPVGARGPALLGLIAAQNGDIVGWVRHLDKAVAIDPRDPDNVVWLAVGLTVAGRRDRARPLYEQLLSTDPLFDMLMFGLGFEAHFACEWERAREFYGKGREISPTHPGAACVLAQIDASVGDLDRMARRVEMLTMGPADHPLAALTHIFRHALLGEAEAADALVTPAWEATIWSDFQYTWIMAQAQAALGRRGEALRWLTRATERGFIHHPFLNEGDPLLANLRGDPGFAELMEKVERRWRSFDADVAAGDS